MHLTFKVIMASRLKKSYPTVKRGHFIVVHFRNPCALRYWKSCASLSAVVAVRRNLPRKSDKTRPITTWTATAQP